MIDSKLSSKILTIGPVAEPKGGISQTVVNYRDYVFSRFQNIEFNTARSKMSNLWAYVRSIPQLFWILLTRRSIRIVHIHTAAGITFIRVFFYWVMAKLFGKKTVMHIHAGSFKNYYLAHPRFVSFVLKRCTRVVALSQEWADFFAGDVGLDNVQIISNVIAPPELNLNRDHDKLHILFLGHLVETKGIFDLLDVAAEHASELRDKIELHVCGAKNEEKVKDVIAAGKMSDFVKFEGWVKGQKKTDLLNLCDVFILPSYIEGLPLSILESMSYKMAILSTNIGGIPGIVHHGHNGYLFTPGDKAAMLAHILDYADHRSRVVQHGEASASAVSAFLPDAVSESLVAMYSDILHLERPQ